LWEEVIFISFEKNGKILPSYAILEALKSHIMEYTSPKPVS
jgi:hypothetical protein